MEKIKGEGSKVDENAPEKMEAKGGNSSSSQTKDVEKVDPGLEASKQRVGFYQDLAELAIYLAEKKSWEEELPQLNRIVEEEAKKDIHFGMRVRRDHAIKSIGEIAKKSEEIRSSIISKYKDLFPVFVKSLETSAKYDDVNNVIKEIDNSWYKHIPQKDRNELALGGWLKNKKEQGGLK